MSTEFLSVAQFNIDQLESRYGLDIVIYMMVLYIAQAYAEKTFDNRLAESKLEAATGDTSVSPVA